VRATTRKIKQTKALPPRRGGKKSMKYAGKIATALGATVLLAACGTVSQRVARSPSGKEPLQRLDVRAPKAEKDLLAHLLAGDFAVSQNDLATATREYVAASKLSEDPAVAEQAVRYAIAARDWDAARTAQQRWRELKPDEPGLRQVDAMLATSTGDVEGAYAALRDLARQPEGKGWRLIGQVLLATPDKGTAGGLLERTLKSAELPGDLAEIWIAMSQLAYKLDKKALARELADATEKKFNSAEALAWSAQLANEEGDKARAKQRYAAAVQKSPKNTHLRAAFAALLAEGGDNAAAATALGQGPQDDYTYAARAAYAARADNKAQLRSLYDELKKLPEGDRDPQNHLLGQLAELLEQKDAALGWYQQVSEQSPRWFDAQLRVAVLLDGSGKQADALGLAHELQARAGDEPKRVSEAFLLEAELLQHREQNDAAIAAYTRGLAALPDDTRLLYSRALLLANLDRVGESEKDLRRVLELKPDDTDAMNALGYTLADGNRKLEEALTLIEKALKAKPDEPAVIDSFGWVQFRLGHLAEAEKALRRAFDKQPDPEIAAHLGEVLWQAGQKDEARRVFEQGRKKDAKNKALLDTMKRLGA
jgi:Flp pilus assembly protein TadD